MMKNLLFVLQLSYLYETNWQIFPWDLVQSVYENVADNFDWYEKHGEPFGDWISTELYGKKDTGGGCAAIEPLNVALITLVALISYFLNCH